MKVSQISSDSSLGVRKNPNFNATLRVNSNIYDVLSSNSSKLKNVIESFRQKLAADPINTADVVELRKITGEAKNILVGRHSYIPGHWQNGVFIRDQIRGSSPYLYMGGYHDAPARTICDFKREDLEIAINNSKSGFCYNDNRSEEQIAEDMYNTYKHVRYLEHYKK